MNWANPVAEWQRLSEHYRRMSDGELLTLARSKSELTEIAQQSLADEISQRKLKVEPEPTPESPPRPLDPAYDEASQLVTICTVWSQADALQVQTLLDGAGIPFLVGPEKAPCVDAVTSNFAKGLEVQIMQVGLPWARDAMSHYLPANEPPVEASRELDEAHVRCPRCHSTEVIFDYLDTEAAANPPTAPKFQWTCDSCGYEWEDDGVAKEG